jgi:flagellar basal-body rod protein FlgC
MSSDIYTIAGSALDAQNARMAAIASNLANADSIAAPGSQPYRAQDVVFQSIAANPDDPDSPDMGVAVAGTVQSNAPPVQKYDPGNPMADAQGYITGSNVSQVGEMVDLIDSSNSYGASIAVMQQASRVDQQMLSSFQVSS